jgi:hypothetical protein
MFIEIIFFVSFMSVSIKVKMSDSDKDPEITMDYKERLMINVTNCSNCYFNFHFNKSLLCRICTYIAHSWIKTVKKSWRRHNFFH